MLHLGASMPFHDPPVQMPLQALLKLVQCPVGKACKHFYTMRFSKGVCAIMRDRYAFWSPVFYASQPPFHCPLEKVSLSLCLRRNEIIFLSIYQFACFLPILLGVLQRVYHFRNASVEVSHFITLFSAASPNVVREAVWLARLEAFDEHVKQFCCLNMKFSYS